MLDWLDTLDLYLHPSYTEGLPRALIEAMSRALPCVASSVGGIPELLPERWMHRAKDVDAMTEKVTSLIEQTNQRAEAAETNYEASKRYWQTTLGPHRQQAWAGFFERVKSGELR